MTPALPSSSTRRSSAAAWRFLISSMPRSKPILSAMPRKRSATSASGFSFSRSCESKSEILSRVSLIENPSTKIGRPKTKKGSQAKAGSPSVLMPSSLMAKITKRASCPHFSIFFVEKSSSVYAARLAFAFSASAPNAAMSCTAMSASTLRSTVMPAFFKPFIRRLYDRPN